MEELTKQGFRVRTTSVKNSQWKKNEKVPTFDSFWMRFQGNKLYCFETEEDSVTIAKIRPRTIQTSGEIDEKGCF
jgi:hypothetical protein